MKHYRRIKRVSIFAIAISTVCFVLNVGIMIATLPHQTEATDTSACRDLSQDGRRITLCPNSGAIDYNTTATIDWSATGYSGWFATMTITNSSGAPQNKLGPLKLQSNGYSSSVSWKPQENITARHAIGLVLEQKDASGNVILTNSVTTEISVSAVGVEDGLTYCGNGSKTVLCASKNELTKGENMYFLWRFKELDNSSGKYFYSLTITDCAGSPVEKLWMQPAKGTETGPFARATYAWSPEEDKACTHTAKISLISTEGSGSDVDSASVSVNVTDSTGTPGDAGVNPTTVDPQSPDAVDWFRDALTFKLPNNKIKGAGDVANFVATVLIAVIGILAFVSLMISSIQYITSGGDSTKAEKAKKTIIYSIIGIVLTVLARVITVIIINATNIG